jgi:hypothetical protein
MEKKFFTGMAVLLLGASLFFFGCDTGDDPVDDDKDETPAWFAGLGDDLTEDATGTVTLAADTTLSANLTVPADKTLKIGAGAKLTVPASITVTLTGTAALTGTGATSKLEVNATATVTGVTAGKTYVWHNTDWFDETVYNAAVAAAAALVAANTGALADNATVDATDATKVNLTAAATVTIAEGSTLAVPVNVTLVIPSTKTLSVAGTLTVAGTIDVEDGGKLSLAADNSNGDLTGTIHVKSGGVSEDLKTAGASLWGATSTGKYVFDAGAKAYTSGTTDAHRVIGGASDSALLNLLTGSLSNSKTAYEVDGTAKIDTPQSEETNSKHFWVPGDMTLTLKAGSVVTLKGYVHPANASVLGIVVGDSKPGVFGEAASGAKAAAQIVLDQFGYIDFYTGAGPDYAENSTVSSIGHNFYDSDGDKIATNSQTGKTYEWSETAGGAGKPGWKEAPAP